MTDHDDTGDAERHHSSDLDHRIEHRMERVFEVAATPEQVWSAIATADGISAWMVPTRLDPQDGGRVTFDHGAFTSNGVVTAYDPTHRFAYQEPWPMTDEMRAWVADNADQALSDDDLSAVSPIATEFLVEAESGGSCVIRVVTSAYGRGADWEREFFSEMAAGWHAILERLATHLEVCNAAPR